MLFEKENIIESIKKFNNYYNISFYNNIIQYFTDIKLNNLIVITAIHWNPKKNWCLGLDLKKPKTQTQIKTQDPDLNPNITFLGLNKLKFAFKLI